MWSSCSGFSSAIVSECVNILGLSANVGVLASASVIDSVGVVFLAAFIVFSAVSTFQIVVIETPSFGVQF